MTQRLPHISASTAAASPFALDLVNPLTTRTLFWRPRFLRQSSCLYHSPFLFWLSDNLRPNRFVSLGLGSGVNYFAICQALDKINQDAQCVGIDNKEQLACGATSSIEKYNEEQYSDFSHFWTGDTTTLVRRFADNSVDLLSIDCEVTDELVENLRHEWVRKLSDKGVVLLHGLHTRFHAPQAQTFLDNTRTAYPTITLESGDGLLVVLFGSKRDEQLLRLSRLKITEPGYTDVHRVFSRLGKAAYEEGKNCIANERMRIAEDEIRELRFKLADAEQVRIDSDKKLEEVDQKRREACEKVVDRDKEIAALQKSNEAAAESKRKIVEDLQNLRKLIETTNYERDTLALTVSKLEAALAKVVDEAKKAQKAAKRKLSKAKKYGSASEKLRSKLEILQEKYDNLKLVAEQSCDDHDALTEAQAARHNDRAAFTEALEKVTDRLKVVTDELGHRKVRMARLEAQLNSRYRELERLTRAIETDYVPRAEFETIRQRNTAILNSTSWKLTAPARRLMVRSKTDKQP